MSNYKATSIDDPNFYLEADQIPGDKIDMAAEVLMELNPNEEGFDQGLISELKKNNPNCKTLETGWDEGLVEVNGKKYIFSGKNHQFI